MKSSPLVELEGIAVTADECVPALPVLPVLPVLPTGKYKRALLRIYVLDGVTAGRASAVLERSKNMLAQLAEARSGEHRI
jgi:hypothetical protein